MWKYAALGAIVIVLAGAAALYLFRDTREYATVEAASGEQGKLRLVSGPYDDKAKCDGALKAIVDSMGKACPTCAVTSACAGTVDAEYADALASKPLPVPYVSSEGWREVIHAPGAQALAICHRIADQVTARGRPARCVAP